MRGLKNTVAIVTGGLGDLGYASARRMVEEGCKVALFDLKPDAQGQAAAIGATALVVDIADEAEVSAACTVVAGTLGDADNRTL